MKKRRYLVPGVLLVAALGGLVWWAPLQRRQPVCGGSDWADQREGIPSAEPA
jgi:hypothetical protein